MKDDGVIMIGLDAFDPDLAAEMAAEGHLPTLARLFADAARCPVRNPYGLFVGALWVNFATALRPDRHGFHCWERLDIDSYRLEPTQPPGNRLPTFWQRLGEAGRKVATVDVPHAQASGQECGVHIAEWGVHDRHFGLNSQPPGKAAELAERFGFHPMLGSEPWKPREFAPDDEFARAGRLRTPPEEAAFVATLRAGIEVRGDLLSALLAEDEWDLFLGVFAESHCVGHHQWHLHDEAHPRFDPLVQQAVGGDPLLQVYKDIDAQLGRLLAAVPPAATMLVYLSHGMTAHHDGVHLLEEILTRLDAHYDGPARRPDTTIALSRLTSMLKPAVRRAAEAVGIPAFARAAVGRRLRGDLPALRARRRFFMEPNNFVYGGVRLNLRGREPHGRVNPAEADALLGRVAHDLLELVNEATGRPAVTRVERCDRHHRRSPTDTMPDLFVEWDRSGPIETVVSPKIGRLRDRYMGWRTGDHRPHGLLLARGPGIPVGKELPPIAVEDIGPSIACRLGVTLDGVDGRAAPWLAG